MTIYIGVDPGKKGGIAAIESDRTVITVEDMPWNGSDLDIAALAVRFAGWARSADGRAAIEHQQGFPIQGVRSVGAMMFGYGQLIATAIFSGLPFESPQPAKWKALMGLSKDKGQSIAMARRMFPEVADQIKNDGRAEALLLAEYMRRVSLQGSAKPP